MIEDHPIAQMFPLLPENELKELAGDIKANGLREPITLYEGKVLDGRNRNRGCNLAGIEPVTTEYHGDSPVAFVISMNLQRRHLSPTQKACVAAEAMPFFTAEAKKRQREHGHTAPGVRKNNCGNLAASVQERVPPARDEAAQASGAGSRYVSDACRIKKESPQDFEDMKQGRKTLPEVIQAAKRKEYAEKQSAIALRSPKDVSGKFGVIVCDPPWPVEKIERDARPNQVASDYPVMPLEKLKLWQGIVEKADDDCHLFLWTTHKFFPVAACELIPLWGFKYVCTFVWHKEGGFQPFGLPQLNCEFCIYARKGTPKFIDTKAFSTCFKAPRGKHSEKPEGFYETICRVTGGRRLDMFSRRKIEGFIGWGKEAEPRLLVAQSSPTTQTRPDALR